MKAKSAKELLNEKYGERGTEKRKKFREDAFSYYFGEMIKNRRKELKLSQNELAERIEKQRPYISSIENGEDIPISNLALVAHALDLSIELTAK